MTKAFLYCRISRDPEGERAGVTRQEEDARALADRLGYEVAAVFVDNDAGASNLSKKPRPEYAAMLEAAREGGVSAIVAYSNSRLTRRLRELEDLLELHEGYGVAVHTVVSGSDDLATADGRMVARIKASVDAAEAERIGERRRRANLARAQQGTVYHGGRPFGWQPDKATLDDEEAALIRQAVEDVLDGVGLNAVCRRWNAAGVLTARGNTWEHRGLRQLLKQPRLAGWRVHRGEVARDSSGAPVRGAWEPVIDEETYQRLQGAMSARRGSGGRRGARKYLLSGLVRCGTCGGRMYGTPTRYGHNYCCRGGQGPADRHTVASAGAYTDEEVTAVVVARLAQVAQAGNLEAPPAPEWPGAARLEEIPRKIGELMGAYNAGRLSAAVTFGQVEALESEQSELAAERAQHDAQAAPGAPSAVDPESFDQLDLDRQRAVCERLLEAVVIAPAARRGAPWTPDRLTYVWRRP